MKLKLTRFVSLKIASLFLLGATRVVSVADTPLSYDRDVRPILSENCFSCHGFDDKKREEFKKTDDINHTLEENYVHVEKENEVIDALKKKDPTNTERKRKDYYDAWKNVKTKGVTSSEKK